MRILSAAASILLLVLLTSCGGGGGSTTGTVRLLQVANGFDHPLFAISAKDGTGRLFVVELSGRIKVLPPGGGAPTVFLDLTSKALYDGVEQGLLGLAFHPQYGSNPRFYVTYIRSSDGQEVLSEFHASGGNPNVADPSETVLVTVPQPQPHHKGGNIAFGPDGYLYSAFGDANPVDAPGPGPQNRMLLLGKMIRIDVDHTDSGLNYKIPTDNPYYGSLSARNEIWALGFRNPWRFSFDSGNGSLIVGDVGQHLREEVDIVTKGGDYGWPNWEGSLCTGLYPCDTSLNTLPNLEYTHTNGRCAIIGGFVYHGSAGTLPDGSYVFGDFCSMEIWTLKNGSQNLVLTAPSYINSFGEDENGEILVVMGDGSVQRITKV